MEAVWKGNENGVVLYVWLNCLLAGKRPRWCNTGLRFGRNENVKVVGFEPPEWRVWAYTHTYFTLHIHYIAYVYAGAEWFIWGGHWEKPLLQFETWSREEYHYVVGKKSKLKSKHSDSCLVGNSNKPRTILETLLPLETGRQDNGGHINIKLDHWDTQTASQSSSVGTG